MTTKKFESGYSKFKKKKELKFLLNHKKRTIDKFIKIKKNEL